MEAAKQLLVVGESGEPLSGGGELFGVSSHQDQHSLVGRGHIERESEIGEVGNERLICKTSFLVLVRNLIQGSGEIGAEGLGRSAVAARKAGFAIGCEEAEGGVGKASVQVAADELLRFLAFVGINANANKAARGFNDVFLAELTVLRRGVAGSEDAGNSTALGRDGHEENGLVASFGFGESIGKNGIPDNTGGAGVGLAFAQLFRPGAAFGRRTGAALGGRVIRQNEE